MKIEWTEQEVINIMNELSITKDEIMKNIKNEFVIYMQSQNFDESVKKLPNKIEKSKHVRIEGKDFSQLDLNNNRAVTPEEYIKWHKENKE